AAVTTSSRRDHGTVAETLPAGTHPALPAVDARSPSPGRISSLTNIRPRFVPVHSRRQAMHSSPSATGRPTPSGIGRPTPSGVGRHRLGMENGVHCILIPEVAAALAEHRRNWFTSLLTN